MREFLEVHQRVQKINLNLLIDLMIFQLLKTLF